MKFGKISLFVKWLSSGYVHCNRWIAGILQNPCYVTSVIRRESLGMRKQIWRTMIDLFDAVVRLMLIYRFGSNNQSIHLFDKTQHGLWWSLNSEMDFHRCGRIDFERLESEAKSRMQQKIFVGRDNRYRKGKLVEISSLEAVSSTMCREWTSRFTMSPISLNNTWSEQAKYSASFRVSVNDRSARVISNAFNWLK